MLDVTVAALIVVAAGLLGWARHRGTRRADLPGLLQGIGLALTALTAALLAAVETSDTVLLVLAPAAGALAAAGISRAAEEVVHAGLVAHCGGPVLRHSRAALPELVAAMALLLVGIAALATGQAGVGWILLLTSAAVGPLVVGRCARGVAERRQAAAAEGYEHELAFWAWELSEDALLDLEIRLENARLARVVGLAPLLSPEPVRAPIADRSPRGASTSR